MQIYVANWSGRLVQIKSTEHAISLIEIKPIMHQSCQPNQPRYLSEAAEIRGLEPVMLGTWQSILAQFESLA
jgi:hypothetical protein